MVTNITRADKWLIVFLLAISVIGIGFSTVAYSSGGSNKAEIWVNGELYQTVPLRTGYRQEFQINVEGGYDIVEVVDTRIRVREADCPTQECVQTGWIEKAPQQIVCLPYRIVVKIISSSPQEMDTIAH